MNLLNKKNHCVIQYSRHIKGVQSQSMYESTAIGHNWNNN